MLLLQEATELSQLFQSIEPAFAAGELQKIADMLATMRRSLKLVGNVPEFSGGMEKLQARGTSAIADPQDNTHTLESIFPSVSVSYLCTFAALLSLTSIPMHWFCTFKNCKLLKALHCTVLSLVLVTKPVTQRTMR